MIIPIFSAFPLIFQNGRALPLGGGIVDDNLIIQMYLDRQENAIEETAKKYGARLKGLSYHLLANYEDSEEIVNDTYLALWNSIPPQRPRFFFAFTAKICRFLSLDRLDKNTAKKRNAVIVELTTELEQCIPDNRQSISEDPGIISRLLNEYIRQLSPVNRAVFVRRYWAGESIETISEKTSISVNAVRLRLHRIRGRLKVFLENEGVTV